MMQSINKYCSTKIVYETLTNVSLEKLEIFMITAFMSAGTTCLIYCKNIQADMPSHDS